MATAQLTDTIRDTTEMELMAINIFAKTSAGIVDADAYGINAQVRILNDADSSLNQEFTAQDVVLTTGQRQALFSIIQTQIVPAVNVDIEQVLGITFT